MIPTLSPLLPISLVCLLLSWMPVYAEIPLPFDRSCPVWHDNDDDRDSYVHEFLLAMADAGVIELVGVSTSTSIAPYNPAVSASDAAAFGAGRQQAHQDARDSGLGNFADVTPEVLIGNLEQPPSGIVEDTEPLDSGVGRAIAEAANQFGTPEKPLVVVCGGTLTAVADACLIDPTITDKVVVSWIAARSNDLQGYNPWADGWATVVVAVKLPLVIFPVDIPTPETSKPLVTKSDLATCLPPSPLRDGLVARDHPTNSLPGDIDVDGLPAVAVVDSRFVKTIRRRVVSGTTTATIGSESHVVPRLVDSENGKIIVVQSVDQAFATRIWWSGFARSSIGLRADPFRFYPLDEIPSESKAAFGIHELSSSYDGPLVTARRESDGAIAEFHEGAHPGSLNTVRKGGGESIEDWLVGSDDSASVLVWHDQSGSGHDAVPGPGSTPPLIAESSRLIRDSGNVPALRFSGNGHLEAETGGSLGGIPRLSLSVWGKFRTDDSGSQSLVSNLASPGGDEGNGGWGLSLDSGDRIGLRIDSAGEPRSALSSPVFETAIWHHLATVFDGSGSGNGDRLTSWLDGMQRGLSYQDPVPATIESTTAPLMIGGDAGGQGFTGSISEVIAVAARISPEEIARLYERRLVSEFEVSGTGIPFDQWAEQAGLAGESANPTAEPFSEGVANLLKYAFAMDGSTADRSALGDPSPSAGLPRITLVSEDDGPPHLLFEYVRRRDSGLAYLPQTSTSLAGDWTTSGEIPMITPIDADWELAETKVYFDQGTTPALFARMAVDLP